MLFLLTPLVSLNSYCQGVDEVRKGVYGVKRQVMREVNRTRRDVRQMDRLVSSKKRTVDPEADSGDVIKWTMSPYVPNSGMIRDYDFIYTFLHAKQEYTFRHDKNLKSLEYDSVNHIFYKNIGAGEKLEEGVEVMGWHPHWMNDSYKNYPYKMLSILSYYSYDINPNTGDASNPEVIDSLRNSSIPDSTLKYGTKLYLSVTSFGRHNNRKFLSDEQSREIFITEVLNLMNERKGAFSGIDLNFEAIDSVDSPKFTQFVKQLSSRLNVAGYDLILDVPYFNRHDIFNYEELSPHVLYFNIMGYDFNGEQSLFPGSMAPLHALEGGLSLETAVNDLLVLGIPGKKILLSLPLYGVVWDITDVERGGACQYKTSLPYYQIESQYGIDYNPFYDALSGSFFYIIENDQERLACWYENGTSLDLKFRWVRSKNLRGVGLWALGYDQASVDIWNAVQDVYGAELVQVQPVETRLSGPFGLAKEILLYKNIIGLGFLVFAGFVFLGFALSLTDWRVREVLFQQQSFRIIYSLGFLILSVVGIQWWWNRDTKWDIVVGLLIGGVGVFIINYIFTKYRDQLR